MDFAFSAEEEKFRREVHEFLEKDRAVEGMRREWATGSGFADSVLKR